MHVQGATADTRNAYLRRGYFSHIGELREKLVRLGMAYSSPLPDFPDNDHLDRTDFRGDQPVSERAQRYVQVLERTLAEHGTGPLVDDYVPGIPLHKLSSADGWHVTAAECTEALTTYSGASRAGVAHTAAFDPDVLLFLRTVADHGGFRVYRLPHFLRGSRHLRPVPPVGRTCLSRPTPLERRSPPCPHPGS